MTRLLSLVTVVLCAFGLWCTNAYAQGAVQASIAGVVRDTSGAVLPGVTIEASSPVLIEKSRTAGSFESGISARYLASTSLHSMPRGPDPRGASTVLVNR